MAEIKQGTNKFYIGDDENNPQAEITFQSQDDNQIDINHTGVPDELGGQGIGSSLVKSVVDYARDNDLKVVASCPFAKSVIEKNPEYQDVYVG
ncbi:N-acetyltransferase [Staphylococcus succinus]|uniref:N-acetyltransferase n=1 Tax=Staphylococcus succinus TaxID=61015 RepID=A0ABX5IPT1_9STAP|nr:MULTISPECIES: GNAT family N-acetyltransferase [Staphylococcus]MDH9161937.1 GNAT family N-acetyltransferase [Staphylococcus succinus]MEB7462643.1 N-acetyltransferase [Staphylococcus succinus]MEB8123494.1 N-acetyltransferase [Staphylococcus succinus]OIJ31086.1 GNAT family N-acetyltransferase [Staphylococcus sp. LCT-H4]PKI21595.1 N-acetyltransferase [Staphylococcus succinus]